MPTMRKLLAVLAGALALASCSHAARQAGGAPAAEPEHREGEGMRHNRHYLAATDSLATRLDRAGTVVIHVGRGDSAYLAGHVPGARFLPLSAVATTMNGVPNEFPPVADMARAFEQLQVGDSARIVIYGDDAGLLAARAWAALDLLGQAERTQILDGGLVKWRAEGRPVDTGAVMHTMQFVPFTPRPRPDMVVSAEWVRAHLGDTTVLVVDARPADRYAAGHLPGARNLYWMDGLVAADNPVLRPMPELHHQLWQPAGTERAGLRTIVVYCQTGMQASHDYFQARYIGYPDVRLFDGSMADWQARGYPVER